MRSLRNWRWPLTWSRVSQCAGCGPQTAVGLEKTWEKTECHARPHYRGRDSGRRHGRPLPDVSVPMSLLFCDMLWVRQGWGLCVLWSSGVQLPCNEELTRTKVLITWSLAALASVSRWALKAQMRKAPIPPTRSRSTAGQRMAVFALLGSSGGIQVASGCSPSWAQC